MVKSWVAGIVDIRLFATNDQDRAIPEKGGGVLVASNRHRVGELSEDPGRRIVDLSRFQQ